MATLSPFPDPRIVPPGNGLGAPIAPSDIQITVGDDGSVSYDPDQEPGDDEAPPRETKFEDNLAETLGDADLSTIASDLLEAIAADVTSRADWIQNYNAGMDLLGLKLEDSPTPGSGMAKSISRVRHPLLLWAVIKGQSAARAELLPAAGPVKVQAEGDEAPDVDQRASDLEKDMNYFLTVTATEYYPDMDRGLFYLYYGGALFKKVYRCPLRNRPVSECVYIPDLIVSNDATDLDNAARVTHKIDMQPWSLKQLQDNGVYRDIDLSTPNDMPDSSAQKLGDITGISPQQSRPKDRLYAIYECYTEYDLSSYGVDTKANRALPYRITIDRDSRKILEIRRNWREGDELYKRRKRFVKYGLVPGFGFLDLGFLHILGNHTKALTALWRITIDAGMFANFPGGLKLKGARSSTNEFNPGPGEFSEVDGGTATNIRDLIMPMPYKDPSPVLLQMIDSLAKDGAQMAGTVELEVGEGRTNAPVGTVMAMVEQQTQVMAACHKRLHTSQQEEFLLLKELFAEDPSAIWRGARNPARKWEKAEEFADLDLVPSSDPNVPAQVHRLAQNAALMQIAQAAPQLFDLQAVARRMLTTIGISDVDALLVQNPQPPPPPQGAPGQAPPTDPAMAQVAAQEAQLDAKVKTEDIQSRGQEKAAELSFQQTKLQADNAQKEKDREAKLYIATETEKTKRLGIAADVAKTQAEHEAAAGPLGIPPEPGTEI